jgi:hypothetical protein
MRSSDTFKEYAADCMRLAEGEATPEAKNLMLNIALAWIRLAQQKQALAPSLVPAQDDGAMPAAPDAEDAAAELPEPTH